MSHCEREDLVQDARLGMWKRLNLFDNSRSSLKTFTERAVASHLASLRRARRCQPRCQPLDHDQHAADEGWLRAIELRVDVERALETLEDRDLGRSVPGDEKRVGGSKSSFIWPAPPGPVPSGSPVAAGCRP